MRIVEKGSADPTDSYLQIKAIEALGRLRETKAETLLRPLAESKGFWRWKHPREVRITAVQALKKIDPEWTEHFLPRCGLERCGVEADRSRSRPRLPLGCASGAMRA